MHVAGLTPASAGGIGCVTGVLVGAMSAVMSGARDAKPAIAELAPRLAEGAVLVTVEVEDAQGRDYVEDLLDGHEPLELGVC